VSASESAQKQQPLPGSCAHRNTRLRQVEHDSRGLAAACMNAAAAPWDSSDHPPQRAVGEGSNRPPRLRSGTGAVHKHPVGSTGSLAESAAGPGRSSRLGEQEELLLLLVPQTAKREKFHMSKIKMFIIATRRSSITQAGHPRGVFFQSNVPSSHTPTQTHEMRVAAHRQT
jgi:hypothetical protein